LRAIGNGGSGMKVTLKKLSYKQHEGVSGIYIILWGDFQKFYVGQSVNLFARFRQHISELRKGKHGNPKLQNAFNKYGAPSFLEMEICDISLLDEREQYFIDLFKDDPNLCNLCFDAKGIVVSNETRSKISESRKYYVYPKAHKKSISDGLKHAYANYRKINDCIGKSGADNMFFGKKHSEESKRKMSESKKVIFLGGSNPKAKAVVNTKTGTVYSTIREAAIMNCISESVLYKWLRNERPNTSNLKLL